MDAAASALSLAPASAGPPPPLLGFGTYNKLRDHAAMAAGVRVALEVGYRHIDAAEFYANEDLIGEVLHEAISSGRVQRSELYVTSKLWNHQHRPADVRACLEERLRLLRLDYLDLFLMHWPVAFAKATYAFQRNATDPWFHKPDLGVTVLETWRAMEELVREGRVRAIGVSNFSVVQFQALVAAATILPATNQVECHPYLAQTELLAACTAAGSTLTAFSPLGKPGILVAGQPCLLDEPAVRAVAAKHGRWPAQVVLRWNMQRGVRVIPKSTERARIEENFGCTGFDLDADDMKALGALDAGIRLVNPHWVVFDREATRLR